MRKVAYGRSFNRSIRPCHSSHSHRNIDSKEDCEVIVQDIFTGLWNNRERWNIVNLEAYLLRVVRNSVAEYFRHCKVKQRYVDHYKLFNSVYDSMYESNLEFDPERVLELVDQSLPLMPAKYPTAFRLRLFENLTNSEIAEKMSVKKATIEHYMVMAVWASTESTPKINWYIFTCFKLLV